MKTARFIALATALIIAGGLSLTAQNKKPQTWEEKKAARFKPITEEQKGKVIEALPGKATAEPKKARRVLVFYRCEGFIHTSIPMGNLALQEMGKKTGAFEAVLADTYDVFNHDNLAGFDAILFNNSTHLRPETDEQKEAILAFMKAGKGVAGIHAAGDNFYQWDKGAEMIGGQFNGHPWNAGGRWAYQLDDAEHVLNQAFNGQGFWHTDEIYQYKPATYVGPEKLRLLVSLDMSKEAVLKPLQNEKAKEKSLKDYGTEGARQVPVSWLQEYGGGRVFYSNFGHREDTFWTPAVLQHFLDGIQYALGDLEADATPTAKAGELKVVAAPDEA